MTGRLVHCCIYYRVAAAHALEARAAILAALDALEERAGIVGHLFEGQHEPLLWMEVYDSVRDADGLQTMLDDLLAASRFEAFLAPGSERRVERFVAQAK